MNATKEIYNFNGLKTDGTLTLTPTGVIVNEHIC